ncbi:hypothetical protein J1605_014137 [Eschrichtius robustus]|uniref:U1-type domain-containing protein n=1 Tax=Eschrichtius robustus TaxID=9764 RepID=A0AB34GGJ7_ESCRO|nr:hypothetical protein J1605_014137 [Eschrichtius robustus]
MPQLGLGATCGAAGPVMEDYWKSQPKKFCDYYKCWRVDNRPSIELHARGKNHKENVAKRISEIKQKSLDMEAAMLQWRQLP